MIDLFCILPVVLLFTAGCVVLGLALRVLSKLGFTQFEQQFNDATDEAIEAEQDKLAKRESGLARGQR